MNYDEKNAKNNKKLAKQKNSSQMQVQQLVWTLITGE